MHNRKYYQADPTVSTQDIHGDKERQLMYREAGTTNGNGIVISEGGMDVFIRTK